MSSKEIKIFFVLFYKTAKVKQPNILSMCILQSLLLFRTQNTQYISRWRFGKGHFRYRSSKSRKIRIPHKHYNNFDFSLIQFGCSFSPINLRKVILKGIQTPVPCWSRDTNALTTRPLEMPLSCLGIDQPLTCSQWW